MEKNSRNVIGIIGGIGSGKDTLANMFVDHGYFKVAFADPIKHVVQYVMRYPHETLWGPSQNRTDEVRYLLQYVGDVFRDVDPDIWINFLVDRIGKFTDNTVISDIRTPAEVVAVKTKLNGIIIKIDRPQREKRAGSGHHTETSLDSIDYNLVDYLLCNNGTLEDLRGMHSIILQDLSEWNCLSKVL